MKHRNDSTSMNEAFKAGQLDSNNGPRKNKAAACSGDKYFVKIRDDKGNEYKVEYI